MRRLRSFAFAFIALFLSTALVSSQGKDKDKDKDPKKEMGSFPTEIAGKDIKTYDKEMRSTDPAVRQAAVRTLPYFGPPARKYTTVLIYFLSATNEPDASVRADAATALGSIGFDEKDAKGFQEGMTALGKMILDEQRPVRLHAISALANFGPYAKSGITSLTAALRDTSSWEVRKAAAEALGRVGLDPMAGPDAAVMKALTASLADKSSPVRLAVILALKDLGKSPRPAEVTAEIKALEACIADSDKIVGIWARTLLMFLDEKTYLNEKTLTVLSKHLDDTDLRVRIQAAYALGNLGAKARSKVQDVIAATKDKEPNFAVAAISMLGHFDEPAAATALGKLLKDEELAHRCAAARAIGSLGVLGKPLVPELIETLNDKENDLVVSAIAGLAGLGETANAAVPVLKKLAADTKDETVKAAAEQAAKYIADAKPPKK